MSGPESPEPNFGLEGRNVLITGGGSGIGQAIAQAMLRAKAQVIVADLNEEKATATARSVSGWPGLSAQVDVADRSSLENLRQKVVTAFDSRLDVIVHCAGQWMDYCPLVSCSEEVWQQVLNVNLTSHFHLVQVLIPLMQAQQSGSVIFLSSVSGRTGGTGGTIPYAVSKGGVNALMRGLARELAPDHIRVNAIAPGLVQTPLIERPANRDRNAMWVSQIPLGRMARPEELVGAALLLASEAGSYITGELIEVNGGMSMN
jgi:3-oxoacyl-[acyl-carrier protein] reductase